MAVNAPNIAVTHIPNTFNYGSMMMAENLIYYLSREIPGLLFFTDVSSKEDLSRLVNAANVGDVYSLDDIHADISPSKGSHVPSIFILSKHTHRTIEKYKVRGIRYQATLGGDDLSEYHSTKSHVLKSMYHLNKLARSGIKIFLVGQTIGPFHSYRTLAARLLMGNRNIYVYSRDAVSYGYVVERLKLTNAFNCADLAFLDLPKQNDTSLPDLLKKYSLPSNEYVCVVPSGLYIHYQRNRARYVQAWCSILKKLLDCSELAGLKIVLLPHVVRPSRWDDRNIIEEMRAKVSSPRLIILMDELMSYQARYILGNGKLTITGRMHAAVSTFQMGKPAISLSYSVKYSGVIGTNLKRSDLIIESQKDNMYSDDILANLVYEKVKYVTENYDRLKIEIQAEVAVQKEKARTLVKDLAIRICEV
jgi:colanic acid/amylovoran biosynthesis protein